MARMRTNRTPGSRMSPDVLLDLADGRVTGTDHLTRALRQAIRGGRLPPGSRLPPSREFSETLLVARSTVSGAYGRLVAEGLLEARPGSGTWVREPPETAHGVGWGAHASLPGSSDLGPGF